LDYYSLPNEFPFARAFLQDCVDVPRLVRASAEFPCLFLLPCFLFEFVDDLPDPVLIEIALRGKLTSLKHFCEFCDLLLTVRPIRTIHLESIALTSVYAGNTRYSTCNTVIRWGGPQQLTQSESRALPFQDRRRILSAVHLFLFCVKDAENKRRKFFRNKTNTSILSLAPEVHFLERHLPLLPSNAASRNPIRQALPDNRLNHISLRLRVQLRNVRKRHVINVITATTIIMTNTVTLLTISYRMISIVTCAFSPCSHKSWTPVALDAKYRKTFGLDAPDESHSRIRCKDKEEAEIQQHT
ncbi:hypothetical protein ALC60_01514, partial [Trachymyrmex zeteki]